MMSLKEKIIEGLAGFCSGVSSWGILYGIKIKDPRMISLSLIMSLGLILNERVRRERLGDS